MALGANRIDVLGMVLRSAFFQVGIGLAIGIPATIFGGRAMASQLFGVKAYDPTVMGLTILVLAAAAFIAGFVPARRAAAMEPMRALRIE
jgi:ABC-type antimicrobial peptide transport system permease subunit